MAAPNSAEPAWADRNPGRVLGEAVPSSLRNVDQAPRKWSQV